MLPVRRLSFVLSVCRLVSRRCHIISTFHQLVPAPRRTVRAQLTHMAPQTIIRGLAPMRSSFVATASPLLCAAGVSLLCSTICRLLPSGGITRLRWYYETIRLPAAVLPSSLCAVVGHTLGLSPLTALSCSSESSGRVSRVAVQSRCHACHGLRPRGSVHHLALYGGSLVDFRAF